MHEAAATRETPATVETPVTTKKPRQRKLQQDRETAISRSTDLPAPVPAKILDWQVLEPLFDVHKRHHDAIGNWMFRHKKFDKSSASILIDIYRRLKKEGFE